MIICHINDFCCKSEQSILNDGLIENIMWYCYLNEMQQLGINVRWKGIEITN